MNTAQSTLDTPLRAASSLSSFSRPAALIGGATALIALTAIATTLVVRPAALAGDPAGEARSATMAAKSLLAPADEGRAAPSKSTAPSPSKDGAVSPARASGKVADAAPATAAAAKPSSVKTAAVSCATCGVVESVTPFQQKGEGSGVGAVGGAVVGGLLGNQVGGGNGKKAMTVIGAVGGGMAGHEIEKRQRASTLYAVKVRMADGSLRSVTQSSAPLVGAKVTLEGSQLKARAS
jgi:outer membrane lipoprotein SlyB